MSNSCSENLTEAEINLSRINPVEAIKAFHKRTGSTIKTSRLLVENSIGKSIREYMVYLKSPTVHKEEIDIGVNNLERATNMFCSRTNLNFDEASKLMNAAVDDFKSNLVSAANNYKGGDCDLNIDNVDYWLWEHKTRSVGFICKNQNGDVNCMTSRSLWFMDPKHANEIEFIDISTDNCKDCPYSDKCK